MEQMSNYIRQTLKNLHEFLRRVVREFVLDNCALRASSLAFSTLLAMVPLTAFIFSLFTGFGAFSDARRQFQQFLIETLVPTRTDEVLRYIEYFIENTRTLGVVGLLFFALTSMLLLNGISLNFNAIWGSSSRRRFVRKFLMYMAVLVLITLLIGAGFSITHTIQQIVESSPEISNLLKGAFKIAPSLFIFLTIWLMIFSIPSAYVNFSSSVIGALAGTVFWELSRFIFIDGTNYMIRISLIYGSIAAIPIFLIWLAINWFIIFLAAEITYVHQHRHLLWKEHHGVRRPPAHQLLLGMRIFLYVARSFYNGESPPTIKQLADRFAVTSNTVEFYTDQLEDGGLLFKTRNANPNIIPRKDLSRTTVGELISLLFGHLDNPAFSGEYSTACRLLQESIRNSRKPFEEYTILQLIEEDNTEKDTRDEPTPLANQ